MLFMDGYRTARAALRQPPLPTADSASRQRVLGWVTDPARYFQALAMLAMPSLSPETFGRVSAEAQASGVPVLVSDVGGAAETLQDGTTGMLPPAGDVPAWRNAILAFCDPQLRAAMAAAARVL